jgi:hypothetical protein
VGQAAQQQQQQQRGGDLWAGAGGGAAPPTARASASAAGLQDEQYVRKLLDKVGLDVGRKFEYLLNTGNLVSKTGLDLSQASGFTVSGRAEQEQARGI